MTKSNDLRHTINAKDAEGNDMTIRIRLNDECHNGHQDFSITGDIYAAGKPRKDKHFIYGGCIHDEILAVRPDLALFVRLHLADYTGAPTHAIENGFYHLRHGFNDTAADSPEFAAKFAEYYRVTPDQFKVLRGAANAIQYAVALVNLGVIEQWKAEADTAIKLLEEWTSTTFVVDSIRTQLNMPTAYQLEEEAERQRSGYYMPQAVKDRKEAKTAAKIAKMREDADKEIQKIEDEYTIKSQVYALGGSGAANNCIYYSHTKKVVFNWMESYTPVSPETISRITEGIKLPEGVTISNKA